MDIGSATDRGRVRRDNEDSLLIVNPNGRRTAVVAVADGMGGHKAGEVASALAVQALERELKDLEPGEAGDEALRDAIQLGNRTIWEAALDDVEKEGMGTTLVAALVYNDGQVLVANVGDSRAYTFSDGQTMLITSDHTWVNQQVLAGEMSEREARTSPFRNLLTRTLGNSPLVDVDFFNVQLETGDALILVSDGVTGYLDEQDFSEVLEEAPSARAAAERLVNEAVERGGADNATAVVVRRN